MGANPKEEEKMKRLAVLLAAAMLTLSLSGLSFGEEAKPAAKGAAAETKAETKAEKKDEKKDSKKKDTKKPKKAKKKEAAGC